MIFSDPILNQLAKKYPPPAFTDRAGFLFEDLVESIISQQLSVKAADTIFKRFKQIFTPFSFPLLKEESQVFDSEVSFQDQTRRGEVNSQQAQTKDSFPTPSEVLQVADETLRACGISFQKISYIKSVADAFISGLIDRKNIQQMTDEEVVANLTQIRGVGKWTAEMILIFTLNRPDVFSLGDLGIRTALKNLYGITDHKGMLILSEKWKPYRSYACWYLWRSLENK